jgi:hypothetical protein
LRSATVAASASETHVRKYAASWPEI